MPKVDWSSLIADATGVVDYARVKSLAAVVLGIMGGVLAIIAGGFEIFGHAIVSHDATLIAVSTCVVPLTGGVVANGLAKKSNG